MNSHPEDERTPPTAAEQDFVRRLAEVYAPPPRTAAQRVAFQAKLDERLRQEGRRSRLRFGLVAVASAAAALLVLRALPERKLLAPVGVPEIAESAPTRAAAGPQEEAILALSIGAETTTDEALPAEYEAIAGVFLGS
jgi:hypothetical protein